ncbi:hypothetical protein Tco_1150164, partial [Tanacetum coccineum]
MPYPRFTKIIINHFLKQHKSLSNLNHKHYHTIKDDGIVSRLKFVRISEDYQEYGLPIPNVMLTDAIKRLESYQMFIKYSTHQISPKKSRGKGSKGRNTIDDSQETVDVSEESEPEPKPLDKSISKTEAEEAEAARKVHDTHARIVTESVPEYVKKKSSVANIMQALKESKKSSKRQPGTEGSNERTSTMPGVPDESTVISATSSEGTGAKLGVPDKEKDTTKEKVILEWGDEQDSEFSNDDNDDVEKDDKDGDADDEGDDHVSDTQDANDEDVKTESDEDEIYKYKIRVHKDEDVEIENAKVEESDKGDKDVTDAAKEEIEKTLEVKNDTKKTELPPSSSSLSVSSGFSDQFLKLSSDSSLVHTVVDSYLDTKVEDVLQKCTIKKEQAEKQKKPRFTIKSTYKAALEEYDLKSALYQSMHANKSFNKNSANHRLYHVLMEALIKDENTMDKGVADTVKDHKRKHDDDEDDDDEDEDPLARPNQGKKTKRRRTKEAESSMKPSTTKE